MPVINDLAFVRRVVRELEAAGMVTWIFGGWAEELLGLAAPRSHHDIDLLYPAPDFDQVDAFLLGGKWDEIVAKRFAHKRAFEVDGVMVELFLVQDSGDGYYTDFWGRTRHVWPDGVLGTRASGLRVASTLALTGYREAWARYQQPDS
ncbi:nucleotidyltransferase domain-containing protein [Tenggerimyces flavus]|uniref:Nucleotidyltransferase domain-containing protein n=1 Tax=Tenggerimyces flavus TaxID=1708749 RepID=A0ABV7Y8Y5_9ACTN|nr:hypothetical protein [Tenggerimyces flavus]MBM7785480.1 hypothetical protein [Tenggerimyces flavus]